MLSVLIHLAVALVLLYVAVYILTWLLSLLVGLFIAVWMFKHEMAEGQRRTTKPASHHSAWRSQAARERRKHGL